MAQHADLQGSQIHLPKVRAYAGAPAGVVTPTFAGQLLWDTSNSILYVATGATSSDWLRVRNGPRPHHVFAYPNVCGDPAMDTSPAIDLDLTPYHYPGVGVAKREMVHGSLFATAGTPSIGSEDDGGGDFTSYWNFPLTDDEVFSTRYFEMLWLMPLPLNFQGWGSTGLRVQVKYLGNASCIGGDFYFEMELLNAESTGFPSFGTPLKATRTVSPTTVETSYAWVTMSEANLNTGDYKPGGVVPFAFRWAFESNGAGDAVNVRIGKLEAYCGDVP